MNERNDSLKVALLIGLIVFIFLATLVSFHPSPVLFDRGVSEFMQTHQSPFGLSIALFIDCIFDTLPVVFFSLALVLYLAHRYPRLRKDSLIFGFILIVNALCIYVVKSLVARPRPLSAFIQLQDFSFPSGHVATAVVFFGLALLVYLKHVNSFRKTSIAFALFFVSLISLSRVYLNVHYSTDVCGGLVLGCLWLLAAFPFIVTRIKR